MKTILSLAVLAALIACNQGLTCCAAEEDGVALAIVYDTSGSMHDSVRDANGRLAPKYQIANRALKAVARQIQTFAERKGAGGSPWKIQAGLFIFQGDGARMVVPFGPFSPEKLTDFADHFSKPSGNTPLGNSLRAAARTILNSPLPRKHVLIITDGVNTAGPTPAMVMPDLKMLAEEKHTSLSVHFVAFDVNANVFSGVKKQGATVVGAADEAQLNAQLEFILQHKILLEEEEAPPAKK